MPLLLTGVRGSRFNRSAILKLVWQRYGKRIRAAAFGAGRNKVLAYAMRCIWWEAHEQMRCAKASASRRAELERVASQGAEALRNQIFAAECADTFSMANGVRLATLRSALGLTMGGASQAA